MRALVCLGCFVCLLGAGCSSPRCEDEDRDGYGAHCSAGPDCDERNAARNVDCDAVPAPDCDATPEAPGCPCFAGTLADCYVGPAGTEDVGVCKGGRAICRTDFYGLCGGMVAPTSDVCNGLDDDCDGQTDEAVTSPCGGCDPTCLGSVWGPGGTAFVEAPGLARTDAGFLTLSRSETPRDGVWLVNSGEDTVSHLSAASATEVGRHESGGDDPSRVAVDHRGDVFVTDRAFGGQGMLAKLGGTSAACVDRDVSGTIDTSTGPADVPAFADDECALYAVPVGAPDEVPRALAVDGSFEPGGGGGGDPWIGLWRGQAVLHVDGETGATLERIELPSFAPYSAAFDSRGRLWLSSLEGELVRIDRSSAPPSVERVLVNLACYSTYDLAVDDDEAIVATGQNCDDVYRYDPVGRTIDRLPTLPSPRGIEIAEGSAFVAHTDGRLSILRPSPLGVESTIDLWSLGSMPIESIGVAYDALGFVWTFSAQGGPGGVGLATRIDPVLGTVTHQVPVGLSPQVLGDATGHDLRGAFDPSGTTRAVFDGCTSRSASDTIVLHVALDPGAASSVLLEYRVGQDEAALAGAAFAPIASYPGSPSEVTLPSEDSLRKIELRLTLSSDSRDSAPLVRRIGVETRCGLELE